MVDGPLENKRRSRESGYECLSLLQVRDEHHGGKETGTASSHGHLRPGAPRESHQQH